MGRCEKGEDEEDVIIAVWQFRGRQKRWKIASEIPVGKQTPATADHSEIPAGKLEIADMSRMDTGGQ